MPTTPTGPDPTDPTPLVTYPLRWPPALLEAFLVPGLGGLLVTVVVDPWPIGLLLGVALAASFGALRLARARRRTLTVTDEGLLLQRDRYGLSARWEDVTGIQPRRLAGVLPVDELLLTDRELVARTSTGTERELPDGLDEHPASRRVQVSLYDKGWRTGPIGEELRRSGVLPA